MDWLTESPLLLLLILCITAFFESFALLGLFIPGVVLLFSLSAIANSAGISPLSLLVFGAIGALAGDLSSFFIGSTIKGRVSHWSWFTRHQSWLDQGEWFIKKWGWLSVITGRFLGPLRPVIPLVAGTLRMSPRLFIPLSVLTVIFWAPVYLLPGYYTGELSELWQLQPHSNRSLIILVLTALAIAAFGLAVYHHTHPERMHLRGWLTRRQADRLPIHSALLLILSFIAFTALYLLPTIQHDLLFHEFAKTWRQLSLDSFWRQIRFMVNAQLATTMTCVLVVWLAAIHKYALAALLAVSFVALRLSLLLIFNTPLGWREIDLIVLTSADATVNLGASLFFLGVMASFTGSTLHGLKRWPIYLLTTQLMLLSVISQLWNANITLTECGLTLFVALFFNAGFRMVWQVNQLSLKIPTIWPLISLLCLTLTSWLLISNS